MNTDRIFFFIIMVTSSSLLSVDALTNEKVVLRIVPYACLSGFDMWVFAREDHITT